jgi:hypothetical protein
LVLPWAQLLGRRARGPPCRQKQAKTLKSLASTGRLGQVLAAQGRLGRVHPRTHLPLAAQGRLGPRTHLLRRIRHHGFQPAGLERAYPWGRVRRDPGCVFQPLQPASELWPAALLLSSVCKGTHDVVQDNVVQDKVRNSGRAQQRGLPRFHAFTTHASDLLDLSRRAIESLLRADL